MQSKIDQVTNDRNEMQSRGVDRYYSSVDLNLADARAALSRGDNRAARASLKRAARYLYGILDDRAAL